MILVGQGHLEEAIVHFSEALRIYPDYARARQNLQESLSKKQQLGGQSNQQ
jgi:tetratricopeptide (TPR) repeat protein